jgi:outer membrane receptor for ferrienterochelin and colicins
VTAAVRWNDARQNINGELMDRPFVSKYKGLVALSYATPLKKWQFDASVQLNGSGRLPDTSENPEIHRRPATFKPYQVYPGAGDKILQTLATYVGGENLGNFTQPKPYHCW